MILVQATFWIHTAKLSLHLWNLDSPSGPCTYSKQLQGLESKEATQILKILLKEWKYALELFWTVFTEGPTSAYERILWNTSVELLGRKEFNHWTGMISAWIALSYRWVSFLLELCLCHLAPAASHTTLPIAASTTPSSLETNADTLERDSFFSSFATFLNRH